MRPLALASGSSASSRSCVVVVVPAGTAALDGAPPRSRRTSTSTTRARRSSSRRPWTNYTNGPQAGELHAVHRQQPRGSRSRRRPCPWSSGVPAAYSMSPVHHEAVGARRPHGSRHPRRLAAGAVVLRLLEPAHGRRLHGAHPQPHVRGAAAHRLHHDGVLRGAPDRAGGAGAGRRADPIGAFRRITLPLSMPGIATAGILSFIFSWNNFMFALVLSGRRRPRPCPSRSSTSSATRASTGAG